MDPRGENIIFTDLASVTYDSPSVSDPVHKVEVDKIILAVYFEFDMELGFVDIIKSM